MAVAVEAEGEGKHVGLAWVAQQLGVAQGDVMALGDGANDVSMLRWAGWSATPANFSSERVRAAADEVLPRTNNEDAVAVLLEEIVCEMDRRGGGAPCRSPGSAQ